MRVARLKYVILEWLYEQYKAAPEQAHNIVPLMMDNGINTVSGVLDYGRALVNSGLITEGDHHCEEVFLAAITIKGIEQISSDIQQETIQLLKGIKDDTAHYYPVVNHLEFLPKKHRSAIDLCNHLHANDLLSLKITDDDVFIRITERGLAYLGEERPMRRLGVA
jgi:hypothetical protein